MKIIAKDDKYNSDFITVGKPPEYSAEDVVATFTF